MSGRRLAPLGVREGVRLGVTSTEMERPPSSRVACTSTSKSG